ncbi:MAG TPA: phosphatidylglycerol lysyltransferase domain-containing protein, partial [Calditrichia bacterium]|nr:phosphatidylglycerol lysyltransferase domain-containing protein [Calditrichia bacterium]
PIVGTEPSCILTLRDEYVDLLPDDEDVRAVAQNSFMLDEWLAMLAKREDLGINWKTNTGPEVFFHGHCHQKALIGMEAVLPLQASSPLRRSLKELIRRGLRHGAVAELSRSAENLEHFAAFRDRSRHGREPQLRHLFQNSWMPEFRIFGFESHAGGWLGLLMLSPHGERDWHVELMLRHPGAPVGIMEALADHVHRSLAGEGFERWSLGEIPFHYPLAPDNRFSRTARQVGKLGNFIYNARGLRRFKGKFDPHWEPLYVCASQGLSWRLFADLMVQSGYLTLLRHRLLHFGLTRPQRRVATAK